MADLSSTQFGEYFQAIHGPEAFPWQRRLLERVARDGRWPSLLDLPTGVGKTSALDVALFHLALAGAGAPRRIVMVVDRRTVVDQAYRRACKIVDALAKSTAPVVREVAARLRALSGGERPLAVAQLRGGMPRDDSWARTPDQPLIAISTVDQVGSRLLFRGYGVSEAMRPIHAGLLGNDALLLLDEVHLSQPFLETLEAIRRYRRWTEATFVNRWQVVSMSATARGHDDRPGDEPFRLDESDHANEDLARRLRASKPAKVLEVKASGDEVKRREVFAEACAEHACAQARSGRVVGVIVNRVATARAAFVRVREMLPEAAVRLVTGRMRPLDRESLDKELAPLAESYARSREAGARPVVIVATQCIEAGADFDFDALVTECAALDALRQRFGRLNRLGLASDAEGMILGRSDVIKDARDSVYGAALMETWHWLGAERDFGTQALSTALPPRAQLELLLSAADRAPVMLPSHLDAWAQTMPAPYPDPDVSLWLHGVERHSTAEVQIVWRADLTKELLEAAAKDDEVREKLLERVQACAPVGLEALSIPIGAARAWLARKMLVDVADVEGARDVDEGGRAKVPAERPALRWSGTQSRVVWPDELVPGMTLVVPTAYGGLADGSWDPTANEPVLDRGDLARLRRTGRATLRLHAGLLARHGVPALPVAPPPLPLDDDAEEEERTAIEEWLPSLEGDDDDVNEIVQALGDDFAVLRFKAVRFRETDGEELAPAYFVLVSRRRRRGEGSDASTDGDESSYTGVEVGLGDHLKGVADVAKGFATRCGLATAIVNDIELAARWHDAGKADPRFQRMLHGGSALRAALSGRLLAKSGMQSNDRRRAREARERSGYPRGARHELSSVALLEEQKSLLDQATDRDLVLHLVASHHGWCRPFAPVAEDREPAELAFEMAGAVVHASSLHGLARLESGTAERFWRLVGRYGWFGLAWLEAILRLADHRRSEQEQRLGSGSKEAT
jgi:CRISPR-associated endonuclease/helicase Cas3